MAATNTGHRFARFDAAEYRLCLQLNRGCNVDAVRGLFAVASRLGDGLFWYVLILLLPVLYGQAGLLPAAQMAVTGLIGVVLYKLLKHRLVRERPYISFAGIHAAVPPLDRYSFPSGHTLHAVALSILATHHFPELGWVLWPFAALVAASRPVLGLHYPTDVAAGALLGAALAASTLWLW
jgi:undecaprenyl-diphosphatase